ncbi:MAG TPA: hypothetical protein VMT00_10925 [Thermoanaerobaculia bacterium]|nr:hypothetical protein [Thermoanaerobaculia bacterium]
MNARSLRLLVIAFATLATPLRAHASWVRVYNTSGLPAIERMAALPDGGVVAAGGRVVFVVDSRGAVRHSRTFNYPSPPTFLATGPKGQIFVGHVASARNPEEGRSQIFVTLLDSTLEPQWTMSYIGTATDDYSIRSSAGTDDGGLVIAGARRQAGMVIRFNANGSVRWSRILNISGIEKFHSVAATKDGGFICSGYNGAGAWLVKFDAAGGVTWQKTFSGRNYFNAAVESPNGDLIIAGSKGHPSASAARTIVVRTDAGGNVRWQKESQSTYTQANAIAALRDGGVIVAADAPGYEQGSHLMRLGTDGAIVWSRLFRSPPLGISGADPDDVVVSGDLAFFAPHLSDPLKPFSASIIYALDLRTGTVDCPSFENWEETLSEFKAPIESMTTAFANAELTSVPYEMNWAGTDVTATDYVCRTVPRHGIVPGQVPATSSFLGQVEADARQREYSDLFLKKEWARLDQISNTAREERSFSDPMRSSLVEVYRAIETVEIDDAMKTGMLRTWLRERPESIAARVALAAALYSAAWRRAGGRTGAVTGPGDEQYQQLMEEARGTLVRGGDALDADPFAWAMRIRVARELAGGDVREMAERAATVHSDPFIFFAATAYLHPSWGSSPAEYRLFAEQAAEWTKQRSGDAIYGWLAYQALFNRGSVKYEDYRFDWRRIQQSFRDMISLKPLWLPSWHRFALLAQRFEDRPLARDLFARPELAWYEGADQVWRTRSAYDAVREWATRNPIETFMEPRPGQATTPAPPPAAPAPVPSTQLKPPPATAGTFQENPFIAAAPAQWPQIVMQNELQAGGTVYRDVTSFLVHTADGVVAVSAVPSRPDRRDSENIVAEIKRRLASWTMWSPAQPQKKLQVTAFEPNPAANHHHGVELTLAPFSGDLPVYPLKPFPAGRTPKQHERVYVVGCRWTGTVCEQIVIPGRAGHGLTGSVRTWEIALTETYDPATLRGAAVLDEDGYVIAVATGTSSGWSAEFPTMLRGNDIRAVIGESDPKIQL